MRHVQCEKECMLDSMYEVGQQFTHMVVSGPQPKEGLCIILYHRVWFCFIFFFFQIHTLNPTPETNMVGISFE